ncbi:hypothetical protein DRQ33_00610 [bacterium]|nr:MAG: hypothetical protein DRQ33_00610 [bacterium]
MKRMVLFGIIVAMVSIAIGDGTVRVYTGVGDWLFQREGEVTSHPAVIVPHSPTLTIWDQAFKNPSFPPPVRPSPWEKLYNQAMTDGEWISWNETGRDTIEPYDQDIIWFFSPGFTIYENISRATIWLSMDDIIDIALLRDLSTGIAYEMPCEVVDSGLLRFHRFDITEFLDSFTDIGQGFRMEFRVINTEWQWIGMIAYMSYDYGRPKEYRYYLSGSGWRYVSMPFKPSDPSATLSSLFPGINNAYYWDWITASWQPLDISSPLTGSLGDIVRTYSILLYYPSSGSHYTIINGYPIYEQRYLDMNNLNCLFFGSVTFECPDGMIGYIPFADNQPDDIWDGIISGNTTYYNNDAGGGSGGWASPTYKIETKKAYHTYPNVIPEHAPEDCIPYSLDLIKYKCGYPSASSFESEDNLIETEEFIPIPEEYMNLTFSEDDLELIAHIEDSIAPYINPSDSSDMIAYLAHLDSISKLPVKSPWDEFPSLEEFHKESIEKGGKQQLSISAQPSPFNANVEIKVSVQSETSISLNIYSLSGNLVRSLYNGTLSGGIHNFIWDGLDNLQNPVTSGTYFARINVADETHQVKIILVR